MPSVPTGLSGAAAVALVQQYSNEPQLPASGIVLGFLNRGVEEVERRIGGIRLWRGYPTVTEQTVVVLDHDVQDIVSANFSMGNANSQNTGSASPFAQGVLVYPMMQMEQAQFMDAAAGFPAVGFGPPQAYFIFQDAGLAPGAMLPAPPIPQLAIVPDTGIFLVWNVGMWNVNYWAGTEVAETVEVVITYTDAQGETTPSLPADATLMLAQAVQVQSPPGFGDADGYNVYAGHPGGPYFKQNDLGPVPLGQPFTIPPPFGTAGAAPPTVNTTGGQSGGGSLSMQLYPAAMIGQVNIYYRARPLLWADTTDTSYTNLDTSAQEAVVYYAVGRILMNRGREAEWSQIWKPDYEAMIASLSETIKMRTMPKSGQVRDTYNRGYPSSPYWLSGSGRG